VEQHSTAGEATGDDVSQRMRFACWITKVTDTHSEHVILFFRATIVKITSLKVTLYVHVSLDLHTLHSSEEGESIMTKSKEYFEA
jgi:hypothetical protein